MLIDFPRGLPFMRRGAVIRHSSGETGIVLEVRAWKANRILSGVTQATEERIDFLVTVGRARIITDKTHAFHAHPSFAFALEAQISKLLERIGSPRRA